MQQGQDGFIDLDSADSLFRDSFARATLSSDESSLSWNACAALFVSAVNDGGTEVWSTCIHIQTRVYRDDDTYM